MNNIFKDIKKQQMSFQLDKLIETLKTEGYLCFFITVNLQVSDDINNAKDVWNMFTERLNKVIQTNILTWGFTCNTMEITENNLVHTHMIIGIKNLTNNPIVICQSLKKLIRILGFEDIKITFLIDFINTKRAFTYLYKNSNENYFRHVVYFNVNNQQVIASFLDELENQKFELQIDGYTYYLHEKSLPIELIEKQKIFEKLKNINGFIYKEKRTDKELNSDIVINMFMVYILIKDIKEYQNFFLKKNTNCLLAYSTWVEKKNLFEKWEEVMNFFLNFLNIYIDNINLYELKKSNIFLDNINERLMKLVHIVDLKINILFTLIEFSDGIYDLKKNIFTKKKFFCQAKYTNIGTLKYYPYTFKNLKSPIIWIESIMKTLNYDENEILNLLIHLGVIFSNNYDFLKKKRVLFIVGESNTYKTTLIANIFLEFFGISNVALMTQSRNFPFQNFNNKLVAVLDEFRYYESLHAEYLKIFENRDTIVEKKFEDAMVISPIHVILLSNENFIQKQNDVTKQKALDNRINTVVFLENKISDVELQQLKKENIQIVVFLCKLYNELITNNTDKRKKKIKNFILKNITKNLKKLEEDSRKKLK